MQTYKVKTPRWLKRILPHGMVWEIADRNAVYLTFDDGPNPSVTPFVLAQLEQYNAKATFFCVGNNVARYPEVFKAVKAAGHTTGNHTYNHLNGWHTSSAHYLRNIAQADKHIESRLFRPPYGRIKLTQYRKLLRRYPDWKVYMWDILSGDFDTSITGQQCLTNVLEALEPGSIVVFHDSDKARERLEVALPGVLKYCRDRAWEMKALPA
ncbi:MAG: polysaccharide deacetylase family protein [Taibaiella sp.]|nr:polysaccharide deacetylase family protein [Taibaiella sp.]